jgi:hypothetical protein
MNRLGGEKKVDRRTHNTHGCVCPTACRLLERERMGKPHLLKRQLDSRNSRRHSKLGNNPLNPVYQFQKARLEVVESNIKTSEISFQVTSNRKLQQRCNVRLFCPDDFYSAHYLPILDFSTSNKFGFQIFFLGKRRIQIFVCF